ncbi:MAG: SulP family inorganic anion transporter [Candidatus Omnitrophica bacterium]|nr:SulP family inorganic anion transporter [Candidatus Omnitrophota bacterium]
MSKSHKLETTKLFPLFQGILPLDKISIPKELMAGLTLAALAVPEVMGYTKIAQTPVITGLYTMLIPMVLFAIFGSSRHLVVGADSATAAILSASLVGMAALGSHEYVALASLLALLSAGLLLLARVIGLSFMSDFLSRTVLIGFLTGVGIQVAWGQVPGMLGFSAHLHQINYYDVCVSVIVMGVIVGIERISKKIPGAFIALAGAVLVSWLFDFKAHGVSVIGDVPQGLPSIGLPDVHWSFALIQNLLPTAFSMFVVILAQSAATSRAYAAKYSESFNQKVDLLGLGLANVGAALSGTFVVNGSPTKTQMVDSAGGVSQLSQIFSSFVVLLLLLFFASLLSRMPNSVLAAVVFLIALQLVDIKGMKKIWYQRPAEFWVALSTTVVVVLIGVEQGIIIAMALSLIEHVRRSYRSKNVVMTQEKEGGAWSLIAPNIPAQIKPGLLLYRFAHTIYYANSQQLFDEVTGLVDKAKPSLKWFCIDASAVADVDFSAAETLREIYWVLKNKGVRLVVANVIAPLKQEFDKYEITSLFGPDSFFDNIGDVLSEYSINEEI